MSSEIQRQARICDHGSWLRERAKNRNGFTRACIDHLLDSMERNNVLIICSTEYCYRNVQDCIDYIKTAEKETIVVVATFHDDSETIRIACKSLLQLKLIYSQPPMHANKVRLHNNQVYIDPDRDKFVNQLCLDILAFLHDQPKLHGFDPKNNSTMNLSHQTSSFMWSRILVDALNDVSGDDDALTDALNTMKQLYQHNPKVLQEIDEFSADYKSKNLIYWYTKKSFFYQSLNAALRTEDINALYLFRLPIVDLCQQLHQLHRDYVQTQRKVTIYHGQYMSQSEVDYLQGNIDNLISLNAFWSTSFDTEVAKMFAGSGQPPPGQCNVLFQIDIDSNCKSAFFAPIEHISAYRGESEVLVGFHSVFEVHSAELNTENNWWSVHLVTTDKGNETYKEYKDILRREAEADNIHIIFGCLMISMGQHEKAVDYFGKLSNRLPNDDAMLQGSYRRHYSRALYMSGKYEQARVLLTEALAMFDNNNVSSENINYMALQFNLANVYMFLRKYDDALRLYQILLNIQQRVLPPDHRGFGETFNGLAWAYGSLSQSDIALEFTLKALEHFQRVLPPNHPAIWKTLNVLAGTYKSREKLDLALSYHQQALEKFDRYLPKDHPMIATTLREIGDIYENNKDLRMALEYDLRSYNIQKKNYPVGHILVASTLEAIGNIYRRMKQFDEALRYHFESIEMRQKLEPPDNFISKHDLGETYLEMGNLKEAIECFEFTCETKAARFGSEHTSTLLTKSYLGVAHSEDGNCSRAQLIFDEVLTVQRALYPNGHHQIGVTLRRMGSNCLKMGDVEESCKCLEHSLRILEQYLAADHYEVKLVQETLVRIREHQQR